MKLLEGKITLVTGASKGIGNAVAKKFAEQGANVAFTYLSSVEKGEALEKELEAMGVKAKGYRSDASDFAAAEELINSVVADFGGLDVLVNNAGITQDNLLMRMTEEMWDKVINVNLKSCFNTVKASTRTFMKQRLSDPLFKSKFISRHDPSNLSIRPIAIGSISSIELERMYTT